MLGVDLVSWTCKSRGSLLYPPLRDQHRDAFSIKRDIEYMRKKRKEQKVKTLEKSEDGYEIGSFHFLH
jgi:hypothetical protein